MTDNIYVYYCNPNDEWIGWTHFDDIVRDIPEEFKDDARNRYAFLHRLLEKSRQVAKRDLLWEGDVTDGPFFAPVPTGEWGWGCRYLVAWKQGNNGSTYIGSQIQLPWMDGECVQSCQARPDTLEEGWTNLLKEVNRSRPLMKQYYNDAVPMPVENVGDISVVVLGFRKGREMSAETIMRPNNRKYAEELLSSFCETPVVIRTVTIP